MKRPRIILDVEPEIRRCVGLAAAKRHLTIREEVQEATKDRLREDLRDGADGILALKAKADPVLSELWNSQRDAEHDRL